MTTDDPKLKLLIAAQSKLQALRADLLLAGSRRAAEQAYVLAVEVKAEIDKRIRELRSQSTTNEVVS